MSNERKKMYICGPMTGIKDFNFPAMHETAKRFREAGWRVVCPAENFDGRTDLPKSTYMRTDICNLTECYAITMLPDWTMSSGAKLEAAIAITLRLRFYDHKTCAPVETPQMLQLVKDKPEEKTSPEEIDCPKCGKQMTLVEIERIPDYDFSPRTLPYKVITGSTNTFAYKCMCGNTHIQENYTLVTPIKLTFDDEAVGICTEGMTDEQIKSLQELQALWQKKQSEALDKRLARLPREEDWDGYGSPATSEKAKQAAAEFLDKIKVNPKAGEKGVVVYLLFTDFYICVEADEKGTWQKEMIMIVRTKPQHQRYSLNLTGGQAQLKLEWGMVTIDCDSR